MIHIAVDQHRGNKGSIWRLDFALIVIFFRQWKLIIGAYLEPSQMTQLRLRMKTSGTANGRLICIDFSANEQT